MGGEVETPPALAGLPGTEPAREEIDPTLESLVEAAFAPTPPAGG